MLPRGNAKREGFNPSEPLVIAGMFRTANGLGQAARLGIQAFKQQGYNPVAVDLSGTLNQIDGHSEDTLQQMPAASSGTLVLHTNAPETRTALQTLGLRRWHNWRIIGYWAWELSEPPKEWLSIAEHLDEIWTPSRFVTEAFRPFIDIPIRTVALPVRAPELTADDAPARFDTGPLRCLVMADGRSSFHRKNVLSAVRIYRNAFSEKDDTSLTVKLRNVTEYPEFSRDLTEAVRGDDSITIIDESLSDDSRWNLIASHHVMLSAHRSEGFGLHLAEAMSVGRVAMATGWSGNMEFMNAENSVPLPYQLEAVKDPYGVYKPPKGSIWAKVDEDASIEAIRQLNKDRGSASRIGQAATDYISANLDGAGYVSALNS
ncbi:MAG: glycosyltransferase [Hyphomonas sp.]